jgi:hypothetical protein
MGIKAGNCAVCKNEISGTTITCPKCETPHHQDCWQYSGDKCSVFGCVGKFSIPAQSVVNNTPPMEVSRGLFLRIFQTTAGFIMQYGGFVFWVIAVLWCISSVYNDRQDEKNFTPKIFKERIENVSAVYMHDVNEYSVAYSNSSTSTEVMTRRLPGGNWRTFRDYRDNEVRNFFKIFKDVPHDKSMWVYIVGTNSFRSPNNPYVWGVEIHVHSLNDLQGGGWTRHHHGKPPISIQGQTNIVDSE